MCCFKVWVSGVLSDGREPSQRPHFQVEIQHDGQHSRHSCENFKFKIDSKRKEKRGFHKDNVYIQNAENKLANR